MKKLKLLLWMLSTTTCSLIWAQTPVGHTTITFNDPSRTGGYGSGGGAGRQIQTEIYYPGVSAGNDVSVSGNNLPVIAFGHGFVMNWDAYDNIWTALVNEGYVIAFPRTEGSISPSHNDFGQDLALVVSKTLALDTVSSSLFFGKLASTSAIMGHSMGGGSSFLAAGYNSNINTIVTLAAANTNPSSITAAQQINIPNLVISGVNDCVAPPVDHQDKMYDSLSAFYKTQINIIGGGHCYFANSNFNCSFGEGTCTPNPTISRTEQQDATIDLLQLWLRKFLKNDCNAADSFQDSLLLSNRITHRQNNPINCSNIGMAEKNQLTFKLFPNPAKKNLTISNLQSAASIVVTDLQGRIVVSLNTQYSHETIDVEEINPGIYFVTVTTANGSQTVKLIKD